MLQKTPVAQMMFWAAAPEMLRVENFAYSFFGIFGVNMPMLYGEDDRAFFRLQEEIIKESMTSPFLLGKSHLARW